MFQTLSTVQRIASEIAKSHDPSLDIAVARGEGESAYTELILTLRGCTVEPCRLVVGVNRDVSEDELRATLSEHVRRHLEDHRATGA